MRDEQTGTFWQQITGLAISGRLAGRRLALVSEDELTFSLWKAEQPNGTVLKDVPRYTSEYAPENWDVGMAKTPTVISYAQAGMKARDLMLGIRAFGASRAFPYQTVLKEKVVEDHVGSEPVLLVVGGDNRSVRAFRRRVPGVSASPHFYRIVEVDRDKQTDPIKIGPLLMDAETGSQWNFEGCAVTGKAKGACLEQVDVIKDYWFDWRNYNPQTTVYMIRQQIH